MKKELPDDPYQALPCFDKEAKRVAIITDDGTEDLEFFYPYYRFVEEGCDVDVVTASGGAFKGKAGLGLKSSFKIGDLKPADYDILYIPGGKAPAKLEKNERVLNFVRDFVSTGRPVVSICHGPQILAAADVIEGKKIAAWPEVQAEVEDAGAVYLDEKVVTDGQFTTGRWPADLPAVMGQAVKIMRGREPGAVKSAA